MSKQGIYKISGNTKPKVGEQVTYRIDEWYPATPLAKRNPAHVTWHLFKKVNGRFVPTNIKKVGVSSFTFNTNAYKDTFRVEAYLHNPEGRTPMALEVQPQPSDVPRINKVELKYIDDTPGTVFNFTEKLIAEAKCMNLEGQYLQFTLWEDDSRDSGHSNSNQSIENKRAKVINGTARAEFMLTKALMRKAMEGEADPQQLEFYVTVEYYSNRKHTTNNVNVNTPGELRPASGQPQQPQPSQPQQPQRPQPQQPQPQQPQPAPPPVQPEPDPQSAHGSAHNTQPPTPAAPGGVSPSTVNPVNIEELLDAYFAKKEYIKETGEEDGTHTYTFGGSKSGNKTSTAEEKNKVAKTILGKIKDSLKSQKKYTTLEVITAALTAEAYGKDTTNQKTVTFKTFKLGVDFKKVDSAPLDSKLYLVARTMLLDGKQVTISIKEKDGLIKGSPDAVLPVLEITEEQMEQKTPAGQAVPGTEKTVFTGTVKNNIVQIPIHLRPKSEEDLKQWRDKLSKGKEDGTYTYTFGGATNITNEAQKVSTAKIILENAQKGNAKNTKIANGKTSSEEEIKKALVIKNYQAGDTITFKLLKKVPEFLYLHAKAQGQRQHDKKFLNKDGAYFQIGNKCPRCESEFTFEQIKEVFPAAASNEPLAKLLIKELNDIRLEYEINTCRRKAHLITQMGSETEFRTLLEEIHGYSVSTLKSLFKYFRRHPNEAELYKGNTYELAIRAYGLRNVDHERDIVSCSVSRTTNCNDLGNETKQEGYTYMGRGLIQLTGKYNYTQINREFQKAFPGKGNLMTNPELLEQPKYAVMSGLSYWINNNLNKKADEGTSDDIVNSITRIINRNLDESHYVRRRNFFKKAATTFKVNECTPDEGGGNSTWHDPIAYSQRTYYNSESAHAEKNGAFGKVRNGGTTNHQGLDLFATPGTPAVACLNGTVVEIMESSSYGTILILEVEGDDLRAAKRNYTLQFTGEIENGEGFDVNASKYYLRYCHLSSVEIRSGEVTAGKTICYTGDSGNAKGVPNPHLHFEIGSNKYPGHKEGTKSRTNPALYVNLKPIDEPKQTQVKNDRTKRK
ncbi:peptidoglycan DD-metalloendopeptidase family protein [Chryseobacterium jejuense]|uniref:Predicted chitinase n=1 Tax=Chryseobacterium jejuense TaxID=445960 RepID=A0A2X2WT08_CHRJE|nr:peptidoglycan DD-metalloendopeptidase family protein [Chryseobacterium jejuense]SDJ81023.1 Predicted chitinase [Chryseobacterium jejuense]SQB43604.1 Predicted chitinase [Chryseobacterium jejuense]